jgi:ABC-type branched-subunit amino acid transport system ATPase component/ABC-type branched-subunit amino acid transport system permease subunit
MRGLAGGSPAVIGVRILGLIGLVLLVLWPQIAPTFGDQASYYVGTVLTAAILTMLAISLNLAMGYAGLLSFLHTGFLAVGGYASAIVMLRLGWNPWVSILVAVLLTTAFAIVVTLVTVRATNIYWGLITLSFDLVVIQIAQQWSSVTGGFNGLVAIPRPTLGGVQMDDTQFYYVVIAALVLVYVVCRNIVKSGSGRSFRAVKESEDISTSLGIDPNRARLLAFALSGAMAGLAGALYAMDLSFISPGVADQGPSLALFIAIFLGGFGTLLGPVLGMVVVTVVQVYLRDMAQYSQLILGCFLLAAILVLPRGIVGTWVSSRWSRSTPGSVPGPAKPADDAAVGAQDSGGELRRLLGGEDAEHSDAPIELEQRRLVARGVSKAFGGVKALRGVDLELRRGTVHGLIGPNGAGKSTLGSCLSAQIHPDGGTIQLGQDRLPRRPHQVARKGLTRVFQVPHLLETATVIDNMLSGMHMRIRSSWVSAVLRLPSFRREEQHLRSEALKLLEVVGLAGLAERPASVLSHGQKRLVEVARAIGTRPRVVIHDEPATGLTPAELEELENVVRMLRDAGLAILLIEHNMEFVMRLCDTITVLNFGEVIAHGDPRSVSASTVVREAYLGGVA